MAVRKNCVVVGGTSGIGAAFVEKVAPEYEKVYVIGLGKPMVKGENIESAELDMSREDLSGFYEIIDKCDTLIITAGIGRVDYFQNLPVPEIEKTIAINFTNTIKLLKRFYGKLLGSEEAYCLTMGSLAGEISSPLFSIYSATKAGLNRFAESVNIELERSGSANRITNVTPISFRGSSFNGGKTDTEALAELAGECLDKMYEREASYIPDYEETCKGILDRYHADAHEFGLSSFDYKMAGNRISSRKMYTAGLLRIDARALSLADVRTIKAAKDHCDYLVVALDEADGQIFHDSADTLLAVGHVDELVDGSLSDTELVKAHGIDVIIGADCAQDVMAAGSVEGVRYVFLGAGEH